MLNWCFYVSKRKNIINFAAILFFILSVTLTEKYIYLFYYEWKWDFGIGLRKGKKWVGWKSESGEAKFGDYEEKGKVVCFDHYN